MEEDSVVTGDEAVENGGSSSLADLSELEELTEAEFRKRVVVFIDEIRDYASSIESLYVRKMKECETKLGKLYRLLRDIEYDKVDNVLRYFYDGKSKTLLYVPKQKEKLGFQYEKE